MSNEAYAEKRYLMGEIEKVKAECERQMGEAIDVAVAVEREACAKIADDPPWRLDEESACVTIATAIRARRK